MSKIGMKIFQNMFFVFRKYWIYSFKKLLEFFKCVLREFINFEKINE